MTPYRPFTCLAATLARCGCPGAWRGSLPGVPVPLEPAEAPRFAPRQRRALVPYRSSHTGSWFAAYETRLCPVAGISGPAGLDNHRNPATTSYHPGGEPGHTLIDTQMGDHDDNWDVVVLMGKFLPDVHREPHRVNVLGDVVAIELSIRGTFRGPFETPAGVIQPTGAKLDIPTGDFWYVRDGMIQEFNCRIGVAAMFARLGVLPDFTSAVAASAPPR